MFMYVFRLCKWFMAAEKYKKYLLFDLDGTLTDPKEGICTCVQYALKDFGIDEPDLDKLEPFIGPPLADSFRDFYGFSPEDCKKAVAKYRERYGEKGAYENKVYPGIKHMLKSLKRNGFHMCVASSKPQMFVEAIMEHFGLAPYFDAMVGSNPDGTRSDKAEVIDEALRQLFGKKTVDVSQVYMIGDRKFDIIGAHKKGIECIAVTYGYGDFEELFEEHADYIVFSPGELENLLLRQTAEAAIGRVARPKGEPFVQISTKDFIYMVASIMAFLVMRVIAGALLSSLFVNIGVSAGERRSSFLFEPVADSQIGFTLSGDLRVIISAVGFIIGILPVIFLARKLIVKTKRDSFLLHPFSPSPWQIILGVVLTVASVMSIQVIVALSQVAAKSEAYQEVAKAQYSCGFVIGLIAYALITPLAEEIVFRGIVFTTLRRYFPIKISVLISAIFFAIYHGNMIQGVYALIMGCVMAGLYEYYGTFWAAFAVHAIANATAYIMKYTVNEGSLILSWPFAVIMLAFTIASIILLKKLLPSKDGNCTKETVNQ